MDTIVPHRMRIGTRRRNVVKRRIGIAIVGPFPPPVHGAARVTESFADQLVSMGQQVLRINTSASPELGYVQRLFGAAYAYARAAFTLVRQSRRVGTVYLGGAGGYSIALQALIVILARLLGCRVLYHHHSFAYLNHRSPLMALLCHAGGHNMVHIALSDGMLQLLKSMYSTVNASVVCSNASTVTSVDSQVFSETPDSVAGERRHIILGHLSNLSLEKGISDVVETFEKLSETLHGSVRLMIAGPIVDEKAGQILTAATSRFPGTVQYVGPVRSDSVQAFFRQTDVFLFPSRYRHEAEPLVVLEAMSLGVPTIAFRVGCLPSITPEVDWLVPLNSDFANSAADLVTEMTDGLVTGELKLVVSNHFSEIKEGALGQFSKITRFISGEKAV